MLFAANKHTLSVTFETIGVLNSCEGERHRITPPPRLEIGWSRIQLGTQYATPGAQDSQNKRLQTPTVQIIVQGESPKPNPDISARIQIPPSVFRNWYITSPGIACHPPPPPPPALEGPAPALLTSVRVPRGPAKGHQQRPAPSKNSMHDYGKKSPDPRTVLLKTSC